MLAVKSMASSVSFASFARHMAIFKLALMTSSREHLVKSWIGVFAISASANCGASMIELEARRRVRQDEGIGGEKQGGERASWRDSRQRARRKRQAAVRQADRQAKR